MSFKKSVAYIGTIVCFTSSPHKLDAQKSANEGAYEARYTYTDLGKTRDHVRKVKTPIKIMNPAKFARYICNIENAKRCLVYANSARKYGLIGYVILTESATKATMKTAVRLSDAVVPSDELMSSLESLNYRSRCDIDAVLSNEQDRVSTISDDFEIGLFFQREERNANVAWITQGVDGDGNLTRLSLAKTNNQFLISQERWNLCNPDSDSEMDTSFELIGSVARNAGTR